jgi:hypothetical protein
MQVVCGLRQSSMLKIKLRHTNFFKQYLALQMFHINHNPFLNMLIKEIATIKPLTPEKARIKALQTQKDNANKALKAERDRQKIAKAQKSLNTALHAQ